MRTYLLAAFYVFFLLAIVPYVLFCMLTGRRDQLIRLGRWAIRFSCRFLRIQVEVSGLDRIDPATTYIFMPNHLSFLDGPIVAMVIPRPVRIILKKSIFRVPVLGMTMRFVGFVPVDRRGVRGGQRSLLKAADLMRRKGYSFLVFPEGTRSRDGSLQAFRRGGFFLALNARTPIVPVAISGSYDLMPRGRWHARPGVVRIAFGEPIPVEGYAREAMGELMEKVREAILSTAGGGER